MAWITPKTDWDTNQQGLGDGDFNRIEGNIELLGNNYAFDYDGNAYPAVKLGNRMWTTVSLKIDKFIDGTAIPEITDNTAWQNATTPAYCKYDNGHEWGGYLYNYAAASSSLGFANGWRVPTISDTAETLDYLAESGYNYDYSLNSGPGADWSKIAKSIASFNGWSTLGSPGNEDPGANTVNNNRSLLTLYPSGLRTDGGPFGGMGTTAAFWVSTLPKIMNIASTLPNAAIEDSIGNIGAPIRLCKVIS